MCNIDEKILVDGYVEILDLKGNVVKKVPLEEVTIKKLNKEEE